LNNLVTVILDLGRLEGILGNFLSVGFNISSIRRKEGGDSIIKAVYLYIVPDKGGDFTLSI